MISIKEKFSSMKIFLDGGTFVECEFENCDLVFSAMLPVYLDQCTFTRCTYSFEGAARVAIGFLQGLFGNGSEGREIVLRALLPSHTPATASELADASCTNN